MRAASSLNCSSSSALPSPSLRCSPPSPPPHSLQRSHSVPIPSSPHPNSAPKTGPHVINYLSPRQNNNNNNSNNNDDDNDNNFAGLKRVTCGACHQLGHSRYCFCSDVNFLTSLLIQKHNSSLFVIMFVVIVTLVDMLYCCVLHCSNMCLFLHSFFVFRASKTCPRYNSEEEVRRREQ